MEALYEVRFRGANTAEGGTPTDPSQAQLLAYKETHADTYECSRAVAEQRYARLVAAGSAKAAEEIDGVVPYVVEMVLIHTVKRDGKPVPYYHSVKWQYAQKDAVVYATSLAA